MFRAVRNTAYFRSLVERLGFLPRSFTQTTPGALWLHAVSVGEVLTSIQLIRRLRRELPRSPVFVSVSTLAGHAMARQKLDGVAAGVFYAPLDYVFAVRRVLRALRPSVVVVLETEIWPNLFREVKRSGAGLVMANGRISDRALPRYIRMEPFFRHVLGQPDAILVQSKLMAERFLAVGAPEKTVQVAGNLKYDFEAREAPADSPVRGLVARLRPDAVWIAASTMPPAVPGDVDEDDVVIQAFLRLAARRPRLLLLLAPRKPERFDLVAGKLEAARIPFLRRSRLGAGDMLDLPGVLLLDTIGELSGLFPLADVVFMGGTLASRGGHNILEPAFFARPVIVGPHMENFREIAAEFASSGASVEIGSADDLAPAVDALLDAPGDTGRRALACAEARRGATARVVAEIAHLFTERFPCVRPPLARYALLAPLAKLWRWGGNRKRARGLARRRTLQTPVISVGNISMGGTGKTPAVLLLAEKLQDLRPGILTRGYGRHSPEKHVALEPGASVPSRYSGDEPQLFLRSGLAAVGIGPDRYQAGRLVEQRFKPGVLILDDGFQHVRLARSVDIVLIDALNPFGGCALFPLGRLREPLEELRRADILLITRSSFGRTLEAVERRLRRYNPGAPVFRASVEPREWVEFHSNGRHRLNALAGVPVGGFCGLGNPQSFWSTLDSLGIRTVGRQEFEDHHQYRPHELRRMADQFIRAGAEALVTTAKDVLNLCDRCEELIAPLRLYSLDARMAVEREGEFLSAIRGKLIQ
ncbi:MAG TPA: tetraacyldisaccharide 4'-kinase [Bryobacteraceae bacterium]|nr:tetraacyldisaccharide 4'-kinase [Bryobacteraceae bacterium]